MKPNLCMNRRFSRLLLTARLIPILIGISFLPSYGMARQQSPDDCKKMLITEEGTNSENPIIVTIDELRRNRDKYYGKTVTVDGGIHRMFTEKVFTIEDKAFLKDSPDVLVISPDGAASEVVIPLDRKTFEKGTKVRVTGIVQPYDRGKLECAYGPLRMEKKEGHSFTTSPVLIVQKAQPAKAEMPPAQIGKPSPEAVTPAPAEPKSATPEPAPNTTEAPKTSTSLPKTAGNLPLLALTGLLAICSAVVTVFRS